MAGVAFQHVAKVHADGTRAVDDLTLEVRDGEFVVIVGPSGSGRTTALRMVAGLEEISEGTISIGGRVVNHVPARDRNISIVFQSYALYPHMTVHDNPALSLHNSHVPKGDRPARAPGGADPPARRLPRAQAEAAFGRPAPARRTLGCAIVRERPRS